MKRFRHAALPLILFALISTTLPATSAAASTKTPSCSAENAGELFTLHSVKVPNGYRTVAYVTKKQNAAKKTSKSYCNLSYWNDKTGLSPLTLELSKNGKTLYTTVKETRGTRSWKRTEVYTSAGRKHFGVKTAKWTDKQSWTKGHKTTTTKTVFLNSNGSKGTRVQKTTSTSRSGTNKVSITLTSAKAKKTRITIREKITYGPTGKVVGTATSNQKKYRSSHNVSLRGKWDGNCYAFNGLAKSGKAQAAYNRVYKLEQTRFQKTRNGHISCNF